MAGSAARWEARIVRADQDKEPAAMTELAHRASNGIDVALLWSRCTGRLTVAVQDVRTGESFTIDAPNDRALDVYNHPYAYASTVAA
jgi:hypothetical protein